MTGYLYVVLRPSDGARKVGQSVNPAVRLVGINTEQRMRCELEYSAQCPDDHVDAAERHAHALLWDARVEGEWFNVKAETAQAAVDAAIAAALAGEPPQRPPKRGNKTARFEMRIDHVMMEQLDYLRMREPDLPTRAEMVRRLVDRLPL